MEGEGEAIRLHCCDEDPARIGNSGVLIGALIAGGRDAVAASNQLKSR